MEYPDIARGIRWGLAVGGVISFGAVGYLYWLSKQPQTTDLSYASISGWQLCKIALFLFVIFGAPFGLLAAFRPRFRGRQRVKHPNDT
jgi:hypothetical protein